MPIQLDCMSVGSPLVTMYYALAQQSLQCFLQQSID